MPEGLIVAALVGIAAVAGIGLIVGIYNGLITVRNNIEKSWKTIDVVLQQRHDELPKLIDTCKAYMLHEKDMFTKITELRTGYTMAKEISQKINIENELVRLLEKVKMAWEQYPDLKASQNFMQVQDRVSGLESKISDYREAFNDAVNIFNIQIERFPDLLLAKAMSYQRHAFLDIPEDKKKDVKMDFGA
jgi:LemA protein